MTGIGSPDKRARDIVLSSLLIVFGAVAFFPLYGMKLMGFRFDAVRSVYLPAYVRDVDPHNAMNAMRIALHHYNHAQWQQAIDHFDDVLMGDRYNSQALRKRAIANINLGRYENALADLNRLLATSAEDADAYLLRAEVYEKLGRKEESEQDRHLAGQKH